jgi:hypothetical protein
MISNLRRALIPLSLVYLVGCAYTGPGLTTVISSTCSYAETLSRFRECVNNLWYSNVIAQGYSGDTNVQLFNRRLDLLAQAVNQRKMSDSEAISDATNLAFQLRSMEQSELLRQNAAMQQVLLQAATFQQAPTFLPPSTVSTSVKCIRIGDFRRQISTFSGVACPAGYAPSN